MIGIVPALALAVATPAANLDSYFRFQISRKTAPSISVAIVKDGKIAYAKSFGYSDLENQVPATPNSVYRLGSVTKQFTATMVMQLVRENKLTLDTTIPTVLPDTPAAWKSITVRELLGHTSGLKNYTSIPGFLSDIAYKPTTPEGILKTVWSAPLDFAPGSSWNYSNTGYEVLGMMVEKLDGRKFAASLHARILDPLGMTQTYFTSDRNLVPHRVQGYEESPSGFLHATYLNMDWPYAAGSMESTTLDLAKWDAALYGNRVLPQPTLNEMWTGVRLSTGAAQPYGFGWQLDKVNRIDTVEHGGGINGFTSYIRRAPSMGVTVIVLSNSTGADSHKLAVDAMGIFEPKLKAVPPKPIADHDPAATAAARQMLEAIQGGTLDRTKFTPAFSKAITPELEKGAKQTLSALGKIVKFELISEQTAAPNKTRTYLATIGTTQIKIVVNTTPKGLIAGFGIQG